MGKNRSKNARVVRASDETLVFKTSSRGIRLKTDSSIIRTRIAREAANLLYCGMEKEYKQAKLRAAEAFGDSFLPRNLEVAIELDTIADEREGSARKERLIHMRKQAFELMKILRDYHPVLVGSVWRGTIHRESDIDITVCHDEPHDIVQAITQNNLKIKRTENTAVTKKGKRKGSFHIHVELPDKENAEIKINSSEDALTKEKCEIYGDEITGLHLHELQKLLNENPTQRFLPS